MVIATPPLGLFDQACEQLFAHAAQSIKILQKEIDVRRNIAATIRSTFASLDPDKAEEHIANALISLEHAKDEVLSTAIALREEIATEDYLWDTLMKQFIILGKPALRRRMIADTLDAINANLNKQRKLLETDAIIRSMRKAA